MGRVVSLASSGSSSSLSLAFLSYDAKAPTLGCSFGIFRGELAIEALFAASTTVLIRAAHVLRCEPLPPAPPRVVDLWDLAGEL